MAQPKVLPKAAAAPVPPSGVASSLDNDAHRSECHPFPVADIVGRPLRFVRPIAAQDIAKATGDDEMARAINDRLSKRIDIDIESDFTAQAWDLVYILAIATVALGVCAWVLP